MPEEREEGSVKAMYEYNARLPNYMPRNEETGNCYILLDRLPQLKPVAFNDLGPTLLHKDFSIATREM
jgi:hypothetical protein